MTDDSSGGARAPDGVDRRLLAALVEDGRISVNDLAAKAGVSRATAYARFERLRADGVITGFRAEVNPSALGVTIAAIILVNVEQGAWATVREELVHLPGFEYLAVTSGGFDFIVVVRVRDVESLRDVVLQRLHQIPAVKATQTVFALDEDRRPAGASALDEAVDPVAQTPSRSRTTAGRRAH
jgi:Lrp/AsnC family transcriptional regulator, leucine-responsive regulatory protein